MTRSLCAYGYSDLLRHIEIRDSGAIVIGNNIVIDGFAERPVRVITHAHSDHLIGLNESIMYSKFIVATPVTLDMAEILGYVDNGLRPLYRAKKKPLNYYEPLSINGDTLTLLNAEHIPGSAQVLVELGEPRIRVGYTGDFKLTDKTNIIEEPDVLIIEATYGNPQYTRKYKDSIPQIFTGLVLEGLLYYKRVYIYAYHGKIQEAMRILRENGIDAPFILPDKVYKVTKHLETYYGYSYGEYYSESDFVYFRNKVNNKSKYIVFRHFNLAKTRRLDGESLHIVLTGRYTQEPYIAVDEYTYVVSLSDHADYDDLLRYVKLSNPGLVIIDGSRPGEPWALRDALSQLGFCSIVLP